MVWLVVNEKTFGIFFMQMREDIVDFKRGVEKY